MILDRGLNNGFLGFDLQNKVATIYDKGDQPVNVSTLAFVGETIAAIFTHPAETANKYVYVQEAKGTQMEILASLEKATGAKWTTTTKNAAEANKSGIEKASKGDHSGFPDMIMGAICGPEPTTDHEVYHGLDNDVLGLKQVPLDDLVAKIVKG